MDVAVLDIAGKSVELHIRRSNRVRGHRLVVRYGLPPELIVRPRASSARTPPSQSISVP